VNPRIAATAVAICAYIVMGGFFAQNGVILDAAAVYFHAPVTTTASLFSYLTGGNLIGLIVCMVIFEAVPIRGVLALAYATLFAGVALLFATHDLRIGALAIGMCGFGAGVGLSTGAVIIAKSYVQRVRAIAFLGTDCTFSLAGYIFPAIAANAIAAGWAWQSGYVAVAVFAALLLLASVFIAFPAVGRAARRTEVARVRPAAGAGSIAGVALFAFGLASYLCGQGAFLIWAPHELTTAFGLRPIDAAGIIGQFWGPSIFGLLAAGLIVTRVSPRIVMTAAATIAVASLVAIAIAPGAHAFFMATLVFGFSSTCLFKLMISIGSEQIPDSPPQLVTFLLLSASIGGTIAPVLSARVVDASGSNGGVVMAACCYAFTLACIVAALIVERTSRRLEALPQGTG
jgi:MFS transporter, TsgA protein